MKNPPTHPHSLSRGQPEPCPVSCEHRSEFDSLCAELATICGPGIPLDGETRAAFWLRRVGALLQHEHDKRAALEARIACARDAIGLLAADLVRWAHDPTLNRGQVMDRAILRVEGFALLLDEERSP